ncbi:MAG: diguanylate cyclase [Terriglobales bacterium]
MILALTLIVAVTLISVVNSQRTHEVGQQVYATQSMVNALNSHLALLADMESNQRAFIITGDERFLGGFERAASDLRVVLKDIRALGGNDSAQKQACDQLEASTARRTELAWRGIRLREAQGVAAASAFVAAGEGQRLSEAIRGMVAAMMNAQQERLSGLTRSQQAFSQRAGLTQLAFVVISLSSILTAFVFVGHELKQRRAAQQKTEQMNAELSESVHKLKARTAEVLLLNDLAHELQLCVSLEDTYGTIERFADRILPGHGGCLALISNSRDCLEVVKSWKTQNSPADFLPEECCALRSGRTYFVDNIQGSLVCGHVDRATTASYFCIPMVAQGETLGVLTMQQPLAGPEGPAGFNVELQLLQDAVAGQVALAVGSVRIRETLRNQTIRDALTGAFNRRYLEASLERELRRSERSGRPLGIMMIDLDHFKRFNDAHGHDAGDEVLRSSAAALQKATRSEDIVCRYGGEEFSVVMPEVSPEILVSRAENIRRAVQQLQIIHRGVTLEPLTVSIGVALCPDDGKVMADLLKKADERLYEAKARGRNQVVTMSASPSTI